MTGLAEFLLDRIKDDEDDAKRAAFGWGATWRAVTDDADEWSTIHADGKRDMVGCEDADVTRHIARWDPARVLAECDAKRRIVERAQAMEYAGAQLAGTQMAGILADLAGVYADHPDFRPEWAR